MLKFKINYRLFLKCVWLEWSSPSGLLVTVRLLRITKFVIELVVHFWRRRSRPWPCGFVLDYNTAKMLPPKCWQPYKMPCQGFTGTPRHEPGTRVKPSALFRLGVWDRLVCSFVAGIPAEENALPYLCDIMALWRMAPGSPIRSTLTQNYEVLERRPLRHIDKYIEQWRGQDFKDRGQFRRRQVSRAHRRRKFFLPPTLPYVTFSTLSEEEISPTPLPFPPSHPPLSYLPPSRVGRVLLFLNPLLSHFLSWK